MKRLVLIVSILSFQMSHGQVLVLFNKPGADRNWASEQCHSITEVMANTATCGLQSDVSGYLPQMNPLNTKVVDVYMNDEKGPVFYRVVKNPTANQEVVEEEWQWIEKEKLAAKIDEIVYRSAVDTMRERQTYASHKPVELPPVKFSLQDLGKVQVSKGGTIKFNIDVVPRPTYSLLDAGGTSETAYKFTGTYQYKW